MDRAPAARKEREQAWIDASRRGDARAFNHLVLRWETPIYNLARRMLHDADEASEATQEVFLAAFDHLESYNSKRASLLAWLLNIARNRCVNYLKRKRPVIDGEAIANTQPAASRDESARNAFWSRKAP